MKVSQILRLNEAKKHSVRYDAVSGTPSDQLYLTSIYVMKKAFPGEKFPPTITVTVESQ